MGFSKNVVGSSVAGKNLPRKVFGSPAANLRTKTFFQKKKMARPQPICRQKPFPKRFLAFLLRAKIFSKKVFGSPSAHLQAKTFSKNVFGSSAAGKNLPRKVFGSPAANLRTTTFFQKGFWLFCCGQKPFPKRRLALLRPICKQKPF